MIRRVASGRRWDLAIAALILAICAVSAFLLVVALPDLAGSANVPSAGPTQTTPPSPTPHTAMGLSPIAIEMPEGADCGACHLTASGSVGTKPIPELAHPLWGWRDCTACHADDRLVQSAPGHSGLHRDDCLVCHRVPAATETAAPRPHHVYTNKPCVSCHGTEAPLPTDMAGRQNCWVCHSGTEYSSLFGTPGN